MAIQHRRGADVDFKAEKMLPGEIAVTIDGTRKVYAAFAPGDVKELASKEEVQKIVDNFENSVDEKINEAVQQVTDEATEQVEGIVAKGEEILSSIPVDYQETVKEVAQLKEDLASTTQSKADAIICEAEGTTIVATDTADAGFEGLSLYGKSKQGSTTGAQLWNGKYVTTAMDKEYGKFTHGTTMAGNLYMPITAGETYTFSINGVPTAIRYIFKDADGAGIGKLINATTTVAAPDNAVYLKWRANVYHEELDECMLNAGTEPLPWEPYTGGKPSPNPEYLQEVVSAGDGGSIDGRVCGKNLLKYPYRDTTRTVNGITFTDNGDGTITVNGTATETTKFTLAANRVFKKGGRYITTGCPEGGYPEGSSGSKYYISSFGGSDYGSGVTGTAKDDTKVYVQIGIKSGVTCNNLIFKPMIRLASIEDDTYEPYKEQTITLQTPNGLPGIPLGTTIPDAIKNSPIHMSGVYWDNKDGQYYIADTVDCKKGVRVQRILYDNVCAGNVSISGDSNWYDSEKSYSYEIKYYKNGGNTFLSQVIGLCTHFESYTFNDFYYKSIESGIMNDQPYVVVNISKELGICTTVDEFKSWCMENDVKTAKVLATPIETPLSDEEILAYKALHTNKPTTTIMNSENVYMKVKYVADTKNHIKQNYIPLSKYTALEERVAAIEELVIS